MAGSKIPIKKVCAYCGEEFTAYKVSTRFCSRPCANRAYKQRKREERVQKVEQAVKEKKVQSSIADIVDRPYLSAAEAGRLIGVSRQTIYRYIYAGKLRAYNMSEQRTVIRREDIEAMLAERPYVKRQPVDSIVITEFYTLEEVCERYKISRTTLYSISKKKDIPRTHNGGQTYWSKKHIDAYFAKHAPDPEITEWMTRDEIQEQFGMTRRAVHCFANTYNLPRKKESGKTFYSKRHVLEAKGVIEKEEVKYYTVAEIMEKYNITRNQVYNYLRQYKVPRIKKGRYVLIPQKEFDQIFVPPIIIL